MENRVENQNPKQKKKVITKTVCIGIAILLTISIASVVILSYNSADNKMNKALNTNNAYEVNSLYSQAFSNDSKLEKYDEAISLFLDKVIENLNNKEYSTDDLAENGYTVVYRDLESDWGDLIYSEDGYDTIQPSISYYNQDKWDKIQNIIESRIAYCSGVAYRENNKQPQEAIDSFKLVTKEDSYYNRVNDELAKCVDLYVEQTLSEAQKLIDNDDISGALSKINSINTYLENNGLVSEEVKAKLIEVKNKYAEKYVEKAESCFKEKDVNGAIGNIEVAIELAPDNADYKTKYDTYEQYVPFYMYDKENILLFEPHKQMRFYGDNEYFEAVDKGHYFNCINYRYFSGADNGVIKYILDGKYDTVTGVFFSPKVNAEANRTGYCYFIAYGDGKEIYKSKTINAESRPIPFSFNVKDIQNLEIEFVGSNSSVYGVGTYSYGDYATISELTAQKNFPE